MLNNSDIEISLKLDENELYYYLLENIYENLDNNISDNSGFKISKPIVELDITRKSVWKNFKLICTQINRDKPDDIQHILKFYKKEYSVSPSINKDGQFLK